MKNKMNHIFVQLVFIKITSSIDKSLVATKEGKTAL